MNKSDMKSGSLQNKIKLLIVILSGGLLLPVSVVEWLVRSYQDATFWNSFWMIFKDNYDTWKKEVDKGLEDHV